MHAFAITALAASLMGLTVAAAVDKRSPAYPVSEPAYLLLDKKTVTVTVTPAYCMPSSVQPSVSTAWTYPKMSASSSKSTEMSHTHKTPTYQHSVVPPVPTTYTYNHKTGSSSTSMEVPPTTMSTPSAGYPHWTPSVSYPHPSGSTTMNYEHSTTMQQSSLPTTPGNPTLSTSCTTSTSYSVVSQTSQTATSIQPSANQTWSTHSPTKSYPTSMGMPPVITNGAGKLGMSALLMMAALMFTL